MRTCPWQAPAIPQTETSKGPLAAKVAEPRGEAQAAREPADKALGWFGSIPPPSSVLLRMRWRLEDVRFAKGSWGVLCEHRKHRDSSQKVLPAQLDL